MQRTLDIVNQFHEETNCLGGTEIYDPLVHIFKQKQDPSLSRHIFLLTDGAVGNTGEVIKLIDREVNKSIQCVHTIGMGSGADKHLVEGAAEAGFGTSALIADQKLVEEKVIAAL